MQSKAPRYWDDYEVGQTFALGSIDFTADEIVDFARQYDPQSFHVDADAARQSMFGGLIKAVRYLELEAMTETGCIFSNGEIFEGLLAPLAIPGMRRQIRGGFEAMGEALKERVESTTSAA